MSDRANPSERRDAITLAALELLAETPLPSLTTRQIARRLGLSQPALFRHFHSREQLLLAVMDRVRAELGALAEASLRAETDPLARLHALVTGVLAYATRHPGLPRLLFAAPAPGPLRLALGQQLAIQRALFAELVRDGQRGGALRAELDAEQAATFLVGMLQGTVLQAQLAEETTPLTARADPLMALWLDGARRAPEGASTGAGARAAAPAPASAPAGATSPAQGAPTRGLVALDLRPILASGRDPLEEILATLASVRAAGVLTLTAPFRPAPLLALLGARGHRVVERHPDARTWLVDVVVGGEPDIEDLCDLEPPEPLERVLTVAATLAKGDVYLARLPRYPRPLITVLNERGASFEVLECTDGTALLRVEEAR